LIGGIQRLGNKYEFIKNFNMKKIIIGLILISFLTMPVVALAYSQEAQNACKDYTDAASKDNCMARYDSALIHTKEDITNLVITITNWFAGIVFAIAVIMLIYGGVLYMTAAGSEEKAKTARRLLLYACIGIAVAILAFGAQALINSFLGMGGT